MLQRCDEVARTRAKKILIITLTYESILFSYIQSTVMHILYISFVVLNIVLPQLVISV